MEKITLISQVVKTYFDQNPLVLIIPAKDLMPHFIAAGIFAKDQKNGLSIRNILRNQDNTNQLHQFPFVITERKAVNTNWFFSRNSKLDLSEVSSQLSKLSISTTTKCSRIDSDEHYILELCDEVLHRKGIRQHRFDFLKGDTGVKLPVDIYYPKLNLVIEYREHQHIKSVNHFDKPNILTVSGVNRGKQRKIYDQRRRDVLPKNGIRLIEIVYTNFVFNKRNRIVRDRERDLQIIINIIKGYN
ncbi:MAG: hypothetical protein V4541_08930 [Bacteroidota bacterium]